MIDYQDPKPRFWSKQIVDSFGSKIAESLALKPGQELGRVVESLGGETVFGYRSFDEFSGGSIIVRKFDDFTITLSEITSPKRDRFTVAHELGHLCMHYEPLVEELGENVVMRATRDKREGDPAHERAEWEANWFAAGFLMPADRFREMAETLNTTGLATFFNVSEKAVEVRKKTLNIA